ncbi:MAG: hypothetical protein PHD82_06940 [Candidatus Riflebacteria bacterium]|nr:hypothetical protein [Candidatus Riflebacteria bacterium]
MSRTTRPSVFFKFMLFAGLTAIPALAHADPIGLDPEAAIPALLLETFFFAIALRAFGFRSLPVFLLWFGGTYVTWAGLIGFPLGTFAAILVGSSLSAEGGNILYLGAVTGLELAVSGIEALLILMAGRFNFLRQADAAIIKPGFVKVLQIAILGNLVSIAAGLTEVIESEYAWLCYLAVVPALFLARHITRPGNESDAEADQSSTA